MQGGQWGFAGSGDAFGANRAVKLVFDLQQAVTQLLVVAVLAPRDVTVIRVGTQDGAAQGLHVVVEAVVTDVQSLLGVATVAQVAHSQGRAVGQVEAAALLIEGQQTRVFTASQEAGANGRRGAEQVDEQPGMAPEVADQVEIAGTDVIGDISRAARLLPCLLPESLRHGKVVVNAGNRLHQSAVAMPQPDPVHGFHARHIGTTVAAYRYVLVAGHDAGHARGPQHFVLQLLVHKAVNVFQRCHAAFDAGTHRRDELQQRLGVISSDEFVSQG